MAGLPPLNEPLLGNQRINSYPWLRWFTELESDVSNAITQHNNLSGIQGGSANNYYHLTAAQLTNIVQAANANSDGYLRDTDWATFNNKQDVLVAANANSDGYLTSGDWTAFNSKQAALSFGNLTVGSSKISLTGSGANVLVGANAELDIVENNILHANLGSLQGGAANDYFHLTNAQHTNLTQPANGSSNGFLTSADWTTFNSKQDALSFTAASVPYADANGNLTENNANLYWDNANNALNLKSQVNLRYGAAGNIYTEDFEGYANGTDMTTQDWTWAQYSTNIGTFTAITGMYGEVKATSGAWAGGFIYDGAGANAWTDYEVTFDVQAVTSGRFIFGFRANATKAYWLQCLPGVANQSVVFTANTNFVDAQSAIDTQTPPGSVSNVKVSVIGNAIKVYYNGNATPTHDFSNGAHAVGSIGVSAFTTGWQIDNIVVENKAGIYNNSFETDANGNINVYTDVAASNIDFAIPSGTSILKLTQNGIVVNGANTSNRCEIIDNTSHQLLLTHTQSSIYSTFQTDANGLLSIQPTGNTVRIGDASNNISLDASNTITYAGTKKPLKAMLMQAGSFYQSTTNGAGNIAQREYGTNDVDVVYIPFEANSSTYAQTVIPMPDNWDAGTVKAKFYWTYSANSANRGVVWGVQGRSYANADNIDQSWGTAQTVLSTANNANKEVMSDYTAAVTLAGTPAAGERIHLRIYREGAHANDTLAANADLIALKLQYSIDKESE